jgi:hypothetical protein
VIRAFLGAIVVLLAAGGGAVAPAIRVTPAEPARSAPARLGTGATDSTPGAFALPQLGRAGFTCGRDWEVQPVFDMRPAFATEAVTIRAGAITRRNFTIKAVGRIHGRPLTEQQFSRAQELTLPFGDYRSVSFTIRQGTEAHEIMATVRAEFAAGTFAVRGVPGRLGACYVKRWSVRMDVSPN